MMATLAVNELTHLNVNHLKTQLFLSLKIKQLAEASITVETILNTVLW